MPESQPHDTYRLLFAKKFKKEFYKLDPDTQARIRPKLEALSNDPRPAGVKKLTGYDKRYRIRIGDYRVIYDISDRKVTVYFLRVRHRSDAYRNL